MKKFEGVVAVYVLIVFCFVSVGHNFALAQEEERTKSFLEERRDKYTADANLMYRDGAVAIGSGILIPVLGLILVTAVRVGYPGFTIFLITVGIGGLYIIVGVVELIIGNDFSIRANEIDKEIKERFPEPTPAPNNPT